MEDTVESNVKFEDMVGQCFWNEKREHIGEQWPLHCPFNGQRARISKIPETENHVTHITSKQASESGIQVTLEA